MSEPRTSGSGREIEKQQKREFVEGGPTERPDGLRPSSDMRKTVLSAPWLTRRQRLAVRLWLRFGICRLTAERALRRV